MKVLIVEDDDSIRENLTSILEDFDYIIESAKSYKDAVNIMNQKHDYELYLLDIMLGDEFGDRSRGEYEEGDGFQLCQQIRSVSNAPIIFLTCCDDESSITKGLDLGADDYIVKPFRPLILISRINAIFRRTRTTKESSIKRFGAIRIDLVERKVVRDQSELRLTPIEYELLEKLISNSGRIVKRESFLNNMWDNYGNFVEDNTLTVAMSRLKSKLGKDKHTGKAYIETIYGIGYRWIGEEV